MSSTELPQDQIAAVDAPVSAEDVTDVPADVRERHSALAEELRNHQFRYYVKDAPVVSDGGVADLTVVVARGYQPPDGRVHPMLHCENSGCCADRRANAPITTGSGTASPPR